MSEPTVLIKDVKRAGNDYYKILGVERNANDDVIRKAYLKLALRLHPDKCSEAGAEEAFKRVREAYSVLSDQQKPQASGGGGGASPEDIFEAFFGGGGFGGGMPGGVRMGKSKKETKRKTRWEKLQDEKKEEAERKARWEKLQDERKKLQEDLQKDVRICLKVFGLGRVQAAIAKAKAAKLTSYKVALEQILREAEKKRLRGELGKALEKSKQCNEKEIESLQAAKDELSEMINKAKVLKAVQPVRSAIKQTSWSVDDISRTPSRLHGVSDKDEREGRIKACNLARDLIRGVFADGGSDQRADEMSKSAQCFACYAIQVYFMYFSMAAGIQIVALAAAFLACKITDSQPLMRDLLLRTNNNLRANRGETELGEEEQRALREEIDKQGKMMLSMINFDKPFRLANEELDRLANRILDGVTTSSQFTERCKGQPAGEEANKLKPKLLQLTAHFLSDAFMGFGPVVFAPRILAAGAFAISLHYLRREMTFPELYRLIGDLDSSLRRTEVTAAIEEVMKVYEARTRVADGAAPKAAVATASTAGARARDVLRPPAGAGPGPAGATTASAASNAAPAGLFISSSGPEVCAGEYFLTASVHHGRPVWRRSAEPTRYLFFSAGASSWHIAVDFDEKPLDHAATEEAASLPLGLQWAAGVSIVTKEDKEANEAAMKSALDSVREVVTEIRSLKSEETSGADALAIREATVRLAAGCSDDALVEASTPPAPRAELRWQHGQRVEIMGLASAQGKQLNGMVGTIMGYSEEKARFQVELEQDKRSVSVNDENLRSPGPHVGDQIEVFGLDSSRWFGFRLNGKEGRIMEYLSDKDCFKVQIGGADEYVKPANLRRIYKEPAEATSTAGDSKKKAAAGGSASSSLSSSKPEKKKKKEAKSTMFSAKPEKKRKKDMSPDELMEKRLGKADPQPKKPKVTIRS